MSRSRLTLGLASIAALATTSRAQVTTTVETSRIGPQVRRLERQVEALLNRR
jgi:hypothetical protein